MTRYTIEMNIKRVIYLEPKQLNWFDCWLILSNTAAIYLFILPMIRTDIESANICLRYNQQLTTLVWNLDLRRQLAYCK